MTTAKYFSFVRVLATYSFGFDFKIRDVSFDLIIFFLFIFLAFL